MSTIVVTAQWDEIENTRLLHCKQEGRKVSYGRSVRQSLS